MNARERTRTASAEALAEWMALSEVLMRGLVHSFNNRLTALSAFTELAAMGDEECAPSRILPDEIGRLQKVSGLFRLLAAEATPADGLEVGAVLQDALALHAQHPGQRVARCTVAREGETMPVRAPRWALLRLLLVLMEAGRRGAERAGRDTAVLRVGGDESWVVLQAEGAEPSAYALEMATECGGTVDAASGTVRLPSLLELRRRERAARGVSAQAND